VAIIPPNVSEKSVWSLCLALGVSGSLFDIKIWITKLDVDPFFKCSAVDQETQDKFGFKIRSELILYQHLVMVSIGELRRDLF
jgi:hypothetical protein